MTEIKMIRGEGNAITFTVTRDGVAVNLSSATVSLVVKESYADESYVIEKSNSDFNKSSAASGIVTITLDTSDSDIADKTYIAEFKAIITATSDEIKRQFKLKITKTVE